MKVSELFEAAKKRRHKHVSDESEFHFGFESRINAKKASAAIQDAGVLFTYEPANGIYYFYFNSKKDLNAAKRIADKVIDKTKESEWGDDESDED